MKKLYILMLATAMILVEACDKEEKLKVEELQQELTQLQNNNVPGVSDPVDPADAPDEEAYAFSFDAGRYGIDAAGSVDIGYSLPEASTVEVFAKDGWSAVVNSADGKSGIITVTAPDPASPSEIVVKATASDGRTTAASLPVMVRDPYTDATRTDVAALAYYALPTSLATDYHFKMMAECGMNMLTIEQSDNWREQLDLAHKYGMKGVLFVNGAAGDYYHSHGENYAPLDAMINEAKTCPGLAAYQIFDEPSTINIGQINFEKDRIEMLDPDHPVYVNLHPASASRYSLGVEDYAEYVETFVTECNLKFITFDQYPVFDYGIDPSWNRSMVSVYNVSKKYNIPFWAFTLCCREYSREDPTLANIRLQCNVNLAYGAQVNQFFVYRNTSGTDYAPLLTKWYQRPDGVWDVTASYTQAYYDCQDYCREMHNRGYVFADSNVTKICNTNVFSAWTDNLGVPDLPPQIKNLTTAGEALISFVENSGNEYIVIVNRLWHEAQSISMELNDMIYLIDHDGIFHEYLPGVYSDIPLEPGDMIVLKYK